MRKIKTIPKLEEKKEEPGAPSANAVQIQIRKRKKGEELAEMIGQTDIRAEN